MKKTLLLLFLCLNVLFVKAQTAARFNLKGSTVDTAGAPLPESTVMLLTPKDSTLVNFARTSKDGTFEFKNLKRASYLIKVTYVGYLPYQKEINPKDAETIDLGKISMAAMDQNLYEVVIKTFRAPLSIKGDTIEYDPKAFKVPPGASVEDLIRRLPGLQVDQDGTIKAQGETVKRVTVDGKRFFGDDTKAATKNLPAEAISKVQVFNEKTEQSRITGVDDGKHEKTLNLELKDSHKKGGFGKATAGIGTEKRLEGKVNYNRFNDKNQFSIIGLGNNTNQGGMSWDDYQDFKGSQSFNWGDDGDFGFGGGMRYISFGGDEEESLTIQAGRGAQNRGFNKNWAGGANYNFDTKKTKFNTSYYYNQTSQDLDATSRQTNFLTNSAFTKLDTNGRRNFNENHRGSLRFEKNLDSLNTLIVLSNMRIGNGTSNYFSHQEYFRGDQDTTQLSNMSDQRNISDFNSFALGNTAIFRHKFKKKGRNFAVSVAYNVNNSTGKVIQRSTNQFFRTSQTVADSVLRINQTNDTRSLRNQVKGSLLFMEPFAKKFVMESFYNFSLKSDDVDRDVFDVGEGGQTRNVNLSRYYTNKSTYNRVGTGVRYSHNGLNIATGLAVQQIQLDGKFAIDQGQPFTNRIDRKFFNFTPNISLNFDLKQNRYLYGGYQVGVSEPNIRDLQPIVDNSNPLYIRVGNPNLSPTTNHSINLGYNHFNPGNFTQMFFGAYYNYYKDQVIYSQIVDENLVTTTMATNISGGKSFNLYGNYGFPIVKTKSNFNVNASYNRGTNLTNINNELNRTTNNGYNMGFRLDYTPSDKFTIYTNANWNITDTKYSIMSGQNQKIINTNYGAEMNVRLPKDIYFNSRFSYNSYVNDRYGFDQKMPILNLSVYKTMLKSKKGEIRLSAFDLFNKNRGISQSAYQNFVSQEQVRTLARYFMLSFTYNMRGVAHSVRRKGFGY
ncbi:TonB-dependent receptor domain-containing protein [Dyadobacter sp. CY323]|uniref:TonB-dependent receptor domain-containing protein n=1 Tax=Dyadobacter sp. CY323 TaxID=2907302 RepID=UPI001F358030|nr:TonB-dependent receptor [Dyadobacter sp. CY323]MCE6989510.1 TonB-dependent receptor [Dyadobacter sp. CY323]